MDHDEPGFWEAERLPQPRRPLEGGALLERLTPVEQRAPGRWQIATVTRDQAGDAAGEVVPLELPMWMPHLPGQHYDVRLTAPDGYRAQRSYSIASSPLDEGEIELTIDLLDDGEVSPYFHEVVEVGDQVEVRGPFASYFVWRGEAPGAARRRRLGRGAADGDAAPPAPHDARARRCGSSTPCAPPRTLIYADELGDDACSPTRASRPPAGRPRRPHRRRADRREPAERAASPSCAARTASSRPPRGCCSRRASTPARSAPSASGTRARTARTGQAALPSAAATPTMIAPPSVTVANERRKPVRKKRARITASTTSSMATVMMPAMIAAW